MLRLIHDPREVRASLGHRGDVAGPQAVRPEGRSIEPHRFGVSLRCPGVMELGLAPE